MNYLVMVMLMIIVPNVDVHAQLLSVEEARVDSIIMTHIESNLIVPVERDIQDSKWQYRDAMGTRIFSFTGNKYKLKNKGAMGLYNAESGKWYVYDRYIVLDKKNEKTPIYPVKYAGKVFLLDQESIRVMRRLIMGFVTKDQLTSALNEESVFGFLNGFERYDQ